MAEKVIRRVILNPSFFLLIPDRNAKEVFLLEEHFAELRQNQKKAFSQRRRVTVVFRPKTEK